jgi:hypothetical protein
LCKCKIRYLGMETPEIFKMIDELVFDYTGKHLDTLQIGILKSVFNGHKYSNIAQEYHCSEGHVRDKAYELWRLLSNALGEELHKTNVRATIERITSTNSNFAGNPIQIGSINLCSSYDRSSKNSETTDPDLMETENFLIEEQLKLAKLETVAKLRQMGLTTEQIAQALDLDVQFIIDNLP